MIRGSGRVARWSVALGLGLVVGACSLGGPTDPPSLALGTPVTVEHTDVGSDAGTPTTTLEVTVVEVREGTHAELAEHFVIDPEDEGDVPWYVDVRWENQGSAAIDRRLRVSMEDGDGNLISATSIIDLGDTPFELCPRTEEGSPGAGRGG